MQNVHTQMLAYGLVMREILIFRNILLTNPNNCIINLRSFLCNLSKLCIYFKLVKKRVNKAGNKAKYCFIAQNTADLLFVLLVLFLYLLFKQNNVSLLRPSKIQQDFVKYKLR